MMLRAGDFVSVFVQPNYLYAPSSATPVEARKVWGLP